MQPDFILKKESDSIPVISSVVQNKIKVFQNSNPNFIRQKCNFVNHFFNNQALPIYEYEVQANATIEMISYFIQSTYNQFPEFNERNINIYRQLADEFEYDEFKTAIEEFESNQPYILLDSYISNSKNPFWSDLHETESKIAEKFDFYLQNDECRRKVIDKVSFTQIHRILSNEKLKIQDHIKFYQFLKELIDNPQEGENEDEIGLLLQFVDFKQLKGPSIADFISMSERYQLHIPGLNSTLHEQLEEMKQEIQSLKEQNKQSHNQLVQEINELREQMKHEIQSIEDRNNQMHTQKENNINQRIENINQQFTNCVNQLKLDIESIQTSTKTEIERNRIEINESSTNQQNKFEELKTAIEKEIQSIKDHNIQLHTEKENRINQKIENISQEFTIRIEKTNKETNEKFENVSYNINELREQMKQIKQEIQAIENRNNQMHTDKDNQINQRIETFNQQFIDFVNQHNLDLDGINTSIKQHNTEIEQNRIHINESFTNQQNEFQGLKSNLEKEIQLIKDQNIQLHTEKENKINQRIDNINQQFMNISQEFSGIKSELGILQNNDVDLKEHEKSIDDTNKQNSIAITEIKNWIEKNQQMIEQLPTKTEETQKLFETQNQSIVNFNQQFNDVYSLIYYHEHHSFKMNETNEGIFAYLRGKQTNEFSPLFYTSKSTSDFYEMMNSNSIHKIGSGESGSFWHEFKFEETIHFSGIKLKSQGGAFPRSFDIKINNEVVYSTKDATELNGEYKEMTIQFEGIKEGNIVRIEQTGENWNNTKCFIFNKIELYSTDEKYEGGVFKSLMKRYGNDPHKIHVIHSSKNFDLNSFHKIDSTTHVCTFDEDNEYFDIEFSKGRMVVNGIRFRNLENNEYLLKGSNNKTSSNEEWETINIKERKQVNPKKNLWYYEVESSTPYKYFRIMNTQTKGSVTFVHLDFFGSYLSK